MLNEQEKKLADSEEQIVQVTSQNFTRQLKDALADDENAKKAVTKCIFKSRQLWTHIICLIVGFAVCYFTLIGYNKVSIEKSIVNIAEKYGIVFDEE